MHTSSLDKPECVEIFNEDNLDLLESKMNLWLGVYSTTYTIIDISFNAAIAGSTLFRGGEITFCGIIRYVKVKKVPSVEAERYTPVDLLGLHGKTASCLRRHNIKTVNDLVNAVRSGMDLGVKKKSFDQIMEIVHPYLPK